MPPVNSLAEHLAPDTVNQLKRAAANRLEDVEHLMEWKRYLPAIYFFGYGVEMILSAACFRIAGFSPNEPVHRDRRHQLVVEARKLNVMNSDPHPLVGWAKLLARQRSRNKVLAKRDVKFLDQVIFQAEAAYNHWRPELRYKTAQPSLEQAREVQMAADWCLKHQDDLSRSR